MSKLDTARRRQESAIAAADAAALAYTAAEQARLQAHTALADAKAQAKAIVAAAMADCKAANKAEYKARLEMVNARSHAAWAAGKVQAVESGFSL